MIGVDIVDINRFKNINNNFLVKTFTKDEIKYIESTGSSLSTIAGLYAAKEAFLKAIKKGLQYTELRNIEVYHIKGAPFIKCHFNDDIISNKTISLSISHDGDYALASVLII